LNIPSIYGYTQTCREFTGGGGYTFRYQNLLGISVKAMPRMDRTIKITDEVHKALIEIGGKSETFSDVIMRLIEYYRKHQKR
jgi:hypothetical protein